METWTSANPATAGEKSLESSSVLISVLHLNTPESSTLCSKETAEPLVDQSSVQMQWSASESLRSHLKETLANCGSTCTQKLGQFSTPDSSTLRSRETVSGTHTQLKFSDTSQVSTQHSKLRPPAIPIPRWPFYTPLSKKPKPKGPTRLQKRFKTHMNELKLLDNIKMSELIEASKQQPFENIHPIWPLPKQRKRKFYLIMSPSGTHIQTVQLLSNNPSTQPPLATSCKENGSCPELDTTTPLIRKEAKTRKRRKMLLSFDSQETPESITSLELITHDTDEYDSSSSSSSSSNVNGVHLKNDENDDRRTGFLWKREQSGTMTPIVSPCPTCGDECSARKHDAAIESCLTPTPDLHEQFAKENITMVKEFGLLRRVPNPPGSGGAGRRVILCNLPVIEENLAPLKPPDEILDDGDGDDEDEDDDDEDEELGCDLDNEGDLDDDDDEFDEEEEPESVNDLQMDVEILVERGIE